MAAVHLRVSLAQHGRQRLQVGLRHSERLEDVRATAGDERDVVRVEHALEHGHVLLVCGFYHGAHFGFLPYPQHQVPLGGAALRRQRLAVGRKVHAHVHLRAALAGGELLAALEGVDVVNRDHRLLRALRDGHVLLVGADGQARDSGGVDSAWDELLHLLLRVVQHYVVTRREEHRGLVHIVYVVLHVALQAKHMLRDDAGCRHGGACR
mmetsp:Transcript_13513/g.25986  ORF Transcript_13513/g.25986 Transcript_13513/m.25986 type:complete len:209 (-) Transcript_13513:61-687(-)